MNSRSRSYVSRIEKKALEKDIRHLYSRITGKVLKENIVRREYEL